MVKAIPSPAAGWAACPHPHGDGHTVSPRLFLSGHGGGINEVAVTERWPPPAHPPSTLLSCHRKGRAVFHWSLPSPGPAPRPRVEFSLPNHWCCVYSDTWNRRQLLIGTGCWEYTFSLAWLEPCRPREYRLINFTTPMKYCSWNRNITEMVKPDP